MTVAIGILNVLATFRQLITCFPQRDGLMPPENAPRPKVVPRPSRNKHAPPVSSAEGPARRSRRFEAGFVFT